MLLLVGGTTMVFANGANGSDLTRVSNNEMGASTSDVVQPQNNNSGVKPLETTNYEPVITFTTSKEIGEKITLTGRGALDPLRDLKIEGATLEVRGGFLENDYYVLTAQTVKIIGHCTGLTCSENRITSIDLSKNSELDYLDCSSNKLEVLDVSNNSKLEGLYCSGNRITSIDLSKNSELEALDCSLNKLEVLDVSNNSKLNRLECESNELTSLVLPQKGILSSLNCGWNKLTKLDLSKQTELTGLYCDCNALTFLDLTNCEKISKIKCKENKIAQIMLSEEACAFSSLDCEDNNIDLEHMEQLINSLPKRIHYKYDPSDDSYSEGQLNLKSSLPDGNKITKEQEQKAKDKGWCVLEYKEIPFLLRRCKL